MRLLHKSHRTARMAVAGLCAAFLSAVCAPPPPAAGAALRGAKSSREAAGAAVVGEEPGGAARALWRPTADFFAAAADVDTTDTDFPADLPVEEELKNEHLYRDIGVFVVVSAFVGYFLVKVFLQGDTDEPPPPKGGKEIPGS